MSASGLALDMGKYDMLWRQSGANQLLQNLLITRALALLSLSLVFSLFQKLAEHRIPGEMVLALILFQAFVFACVSKGFDWARKLTLAAGAVGILVFCLRLSLGMPGDMGTIAMNAIQSALDLTAMLLLIKWEAKSAVTASNLRKDATTGTQVRDHTANGMVRSSGKSASRDSRHTYSASGASRSRERLVAMTGGATAAALASYMVNSSDDEWNGEALSHDAFMTDFNPANGLPMVGGVGGFDIAGNPYGSSSLSDRYHHTDINLLADHLGSPIDHHHTDLNPASGLPMMDDSSIDIAGNPYGEDFLSSSVGYDSSFGGGFDS